MAGITEVVFSEAEARKVGIRVEGAAKADINECTGSIEEELLVKTITKKCRGVVVKSRTKGTGSGTAKATLHMAQDMFAALYGMKQTGLKDGIIAYGTKSLHPVVAITVLVMDEDDNEKLKAYPNCSIQSALSRKIENGTEEIAEIEIEFAIMPDEFGNGLYEAVVTDLTDEALKTKWLEEFEPSMAQLASA